MGSDGIVRGSYSFLDDKGVQRTVQYEAGAGIGYRVIKTTVGPLTHVLSPPIVPVLGLRDNLANDISAPISNRIDDTNSYTTPPSRPFTTPANRPFTTPANRPFTTPASRPSDNQSYPNNRNPSGRNPNARNPNGRNPGGRRRRPVQPNNNDRRVRPGFTDANTVPSNEDPSKSNSNSGSNDLSEPRGPIVTTSSSNENFNTEYPESTFNIKKLNDARDEDWKKERKDSTVIKNVGDDYVGLPPGSAVRAHVQSIDLIPLGERAPSPADALRRESEDDYY